MVWLLTFLRHDYSGSDQTLLRWILHHRRKQECKSVGGRLKNPSWTGFIKNVKCDSWLFIKTTLGYFLIVVAVIIIIIIVVKRPVHVVKVSLSPDTLNYN